MSFSQSLYIKPFFRVSWVKFSLPLSRPENTYNSSKGDDPPRDRTAELRVLGFPTRHLGPVQMTTDTALGVTKLVVHDATPLDKIPYVVCPKSPRFPTGWPLNRDILGFPYDPFQRKRISRDAF